MNFAMPSTVNFLEIVNPQPNPRSTSQHRTEEDAFQTVGRIELFSILGRPGEDPGEAAAAVAAGRGIRRTAGERGNLDNHQCPC